MDSSIVFEKTPKGEEALRHRDESLPSDLRMVLLIINGIRNVETVQLISDPCKESIAPLIFLEDNGYIQRIGSRANVFSLRGNNAVAMAPAPEQAPQRSPMAEPVAQTAPAAQHQPAAQAVPQYTLAPQPQTFFEPVQAPQDNSLILKVAALRAYLAQTLGQDANAVINRVAEVRTHDEYAAIVKKLYGIIREYAGVRDAERFIQRFEQN
jgi:hypothetical protein